MSVCEQANERMNEKALHTTPRTHKSHTRLASL